MAKRKPRDKADQTEAQPPPNPALGPADPLAREQQFAEERITELRPRDKRDDDTADRD